jgi:hypothetical protein
MLLLNDFLNVRFVFLTAGLVAYTLWVVVLVYCLAAQSDDTETSALNSTYAMPRPLALYAWSIGQWCYWISPSVSELLTAGAWQSLERKQRQQQNRETRATAAESSMQNVSDIPTIIIQDFVGDETGALEFLRSTYGQSWQERPLHLKGLWDPITLQSSQTTRQLSPNGLLQMDFTIPFFKDARINGVLKPDAAAPVKEIVQRMLQGHPHKIGSQFIVQHHPELLLEVAPLSLITKLFGDYFSRDKLLGQGKTLGVFPGITTVPVFVANGNATTSDQCQEQETQEGPGTESSNNGYNAQNEDGTCQKDGSTKTQQQSPLTGLHCEPIANIAVQLHGFRKWTLVDPQHSWILRPAASKDGRSFYPSWATTLDHVPRYEVITYPGDAIFIPTWTWHRVDYLKECADLSIGASLFHFRVWDYLRRNPLFAILLVPALVGELVGISSQ